MNKDVRSHYGYIGEEYKRFRHYAWRYLLLFSFLYCALYCTRLNLSSAGAVMMKELNFTKADIGILTSALFWAYGFGQLINGRLSDQIGAEKFIIISVVASIAANLLMSAQTALVAMAVIWAMNGYVQSMAWAPGIAIITRWWPDKERGFATGFALAFSGFGQVVVTLAVSLAFSQFASLGWRGAFIVPAVFPMLLLVVYLVFVKTSPVQIGLHEYAEENEEEKAHEEEMMAIVKKKGVLYPYKYIASNRHFVSWFFIILFAGIARYGLSTWVPLYFIEKYNVDITSGLLQSLMLPLGMGMGTIIVPWLTDKYCPHNRITVVVISAAVAAVTIFAMILLNPLIVSQLVIIEILLFVSGFCIFAISGTSGAYATDVGGRVFSGTATGILSFAAYMGAAIQSLVYGFALDSTGWNLVFVSISVLCIIIFLISFADSVSASRALRKEK